MAASLDLPSALSFFICSINSLAAFRTPGTGRSSSLSIRSTAMKQAAGAGVSTSRMLSGQAITAASCTFSHASGKLAISSGFFCTAAICCFREGFSIFRIMSGSSRILSVRIRSEDRLFSFNITWFVWGYTFMISGARYGGSLQLYCDIRFFRTLETVFYHWSGFL